MAIQPHVVRGCHKFLKYLEKPHFNNFLSLNRFILNTVKRLPAASSSGSFDCSNYFHTSSISRFPRSKSHKISPHEANVILRTNQHSVDIGAGVNPTVATGDVTPPPLFSITSVDSNQLAANMPIEDKMTSARCLHTTGFLFGVFDGHGGPECAQVVAKRLFDYVAAALLPRPRLKRILQQWKSGETVDLIEIYYEKVRFVPELAAIYQQSLVRWCDKLAEDTKDGQFNMHDALTGAFLQLDKDLEEEVLHAAEYSPATREALVRVAHSGSVACVAHIDGQHLHVAHVGDCGAILGCNEGDMRNWSSVKLTKNHDHDNDDEIARILSEHPASEAENVINNQRLLGALMPFRAFGDFRFKWSREQQEEIFRINTSIDILAKRCFTPPYLTAEPTVMYHRLHPYDRFLVLATDGLFDCLTSYDISHLVGEYMCGRQTLAPVQLPARPITLAEISNLLDQRQRGLRLKPVDVNAATHLIRHSIGTSDRGLDHGTLAHALTLAPEMRRYFRDDISLHVIFFDREYLRFCPVE